MDQKELNSKNDVPEMEESINWLPWIAGVLILLASLWYLKGCRDKVNEMKKAEAEAAAKAVRDSLDNATKVLRTDSEQK